MQGLFRSGIGLSHYKGLYIDTIMCCTVVLTYGTRVPVGSAEWGLISARNYSLNIITMKTIYNRPWFQIAASPPKKRQAMAVKNEQFIEEYLAWKQSYTNTAFRAYRVWVTRFQLFANKYPEAMTHTDYVAFADSIRNKYAPRCIEFALNIVHNYLRFFAEQGRLHFPMYLVRVPKAHSNSHAAVTEEEYQTIIETMKKNHPHENRNRAIVMLLHDTGMRIGELLSLKTDDIEEDKSAIIHTEKTIRTRRVFWNASTDAVLHNYLVERINSGPKDSDFLFASHRMSKTNNLSSRSVQRMFLRTLGAATITRKLCLHSFRHSFIHRLAKLGVPDAIIAQLVGHSTPFTISHYTKLSRPEFQSYAIKQLAFAENATENMAV